MTGLAEAVRPLNGLIAATGVYLGWAVQRNDPFHLNPAILLLCLATLLVLSGGNLLNDLNDISIDLKAHPERSIVSGKISPRFARYGFAVSWFISIALISAASILEGILGPFLILIIAMITIVLYEEHLKNCGLLGNIAVSMLTGLPFILGSIIAGGPELVILAVFTMAFTANLSREIVKDIQDMDADSLHRKSLPVSSGKINARMVSSISIVIAILISFLVVCKIGIFLPYLILVLLADLIFFLSIFIDDPGKSQKLIKAGMGIALVAFFSISLA
jgi:4-hydroxybenzoate polyprenyltransferase